MSGCGHPLKVNLMDAWNVPQRTPTRLWSRSMGYPSQPQGPYGQNQPQQSYGHSGPQQPGYGYQAPTPPPPPKRNIGLILTLAIGIPLLLMGGCAAVMLVLADPGRQAVVTTADSPNAVMPTRLPESSAPVDEAVESQPAEQPAQQQTDQGPSTATVGGALTLAGTKPGEKVTVTLTQVFDPATSDNEFMKPKAANKFVAVELTLQNVGEAVYTDSPMIGSKLIDGENQQYNATLFSVREGQAFGGSVTINAGDTRKGVIAFEVPESAKLAKLQFALNAGFSGQKGEWTLS